MSNVQARLELNTASTKDLINLLVSSLASTGPQTGTRGYRATIDLVIYEDDTRKGQRNGHAARISVSGESAGVFTTAYDVVVDGE
jgi:hypothetical protein